MASGPKSLRKEPNYEVLEDQIDFLLNLKFYKKGKPVEIDVTSELTVDEQDYIRKRYLTAGLEFSRV